MPEVIPWEIKKIERKSGGLLILFERLVDKGSIDTYQTQKFFISTNTLANLLTHLGL